MDDYFKLHKEHYEQEHGKPSWAYQQYQKFRQTPKRTLCTILVTIHTLLGKLDTESLQNMMQGESIDMKAIGREPTIIFVEISDTDRSKDILANMFYSQAMNQLCSFADEECDDSCLPVPVRFILDDFGTNCRVEGFENMISNIRSRGISATIIIQSVSQLLAGYGDSAHTIMDNCDTMVYLGGNSNDTASMIARRANKSLRQVLEMPVSTNWTFRRGQAPVFSHTVDLSEYEPVILDHD
jgi:type IV secretion system protein VirD4